MQDGFEGFSLVWDVGHERGCWDWDWGMFDLIFVRFGSPSVIDIIIQQLPYTPFLEESSPIGVNSCLNLRWLFTMAVNLSLRLQLRDLGGQMGRAETIMPIFDSPHQ